jgi:hypothetical protein
MSDPEPPRALGQEPSIVADVRAINDAVNVADVEKSVAMLHAILQWLYERRMLDEDGIGVWKDGSNGQVVAEGPRRLVRTTGQYTPTQAPSRQEIAPSELFGSLQATKLGVVRQLRADLPNEAPPDVVDGLSALERLLTA